TGRVVAQLEAGEIPWRPGALELLAELQERGVPCALVSASYRRMLDVVVRRLPVGRFDAVVSGDEVTHGKPHPEPYLTAAAALGVDPTQCVVIEDSGPGSASGNAAGALVLAVKNMVDIPTNDRRLHLDTLSGVTVDRVQAWLADA
ncbi:MAG: HAD family hydrolase, partial [Propionibacteriales bacterium]|nr:HAD family hydrolase [Propionibacteriales bacterium]